MSAEQHPTVVIGAGAAGLLAAARAAQRGRGVLLLEKNRKAGVKILMSGGTRCNLTQATDRRGIVKAFGKQGPFLHSALAALSPQDLIQLFEQEGVPTKREATGKIFPQSDRAMDVLQALLRQLRRNGAELALDEAVASIERDDDGFSLRTSRRSLTTPRLLITCGGQSYPGCGTTGDGYAWARALGHAIIQPVPALAPLATDAPWAAELSGVTLPDVRATLVRRHCEGPAANARRRPIADSQRGSFLFTHFGLSGPVVMNLSRFVSLHLADGDLAIECDFLPDVSADALQQLWRIEAEQSGKKLALGSYAQWLPRRLAEALWRQAAVPEDRKVAELSRAQRAALIQAAKQTLIPVTGTLGFAKAEVTAGGVSLDEVDSRTMQSKLVPGLFFAGEVLDLDGPIGGYNFQAAFSTGWLAGSYL